MASFVVVALAGAGVMVHGASDHARKADPKVINGAIQDDLRSLDRGLRRVSDFFAPIRFSPPEEKVNEIDANPSTEGESCVPWSGLL